MIDYLILLMVGILAYITQKALREIMFILDSRLMQRKEAEMRLHGVIVYLRSDKAKVSSADEQSKRVLDILGAYE